MDNSDSYKVDRSTKWHFHYIFFFSSFTRWLAKGPSFTITEQLSWIFLLLLPVTPAETKSSPINYIFGDARVGFYNNCLENVLVIKYIVFRNIYFLFIKTNIFVIYIETFTRRR